jgi:hypothetical protein
MMTPNIVSVQGVKTPPNVPNPAAMPLVELGLIRESKVVTGARQGTGKASDYTKQNH